MTRVALVAVIGACAACVGCGYRANDHFRTDVNTVYVEIFESREFRRDLEFFLTEAVKKRIATDTPYRLAPKTVADTILRGEVLEQRVAAFAPDFVSRLPRDKQVTMAVRVEWRDLRNNEILLDQPVLLQAADYLPPAGETEEFAQEKALDKLAERIIRKMYAPW